MMIGQRVIYRVNSGKSLSTYDDRACAILCAKAHLSKRLPRGRRTKDALMAMKVEEYDNHIVVLSEQDRVTISKETIG